MKAERGAIAGGPDMLVGRFTVKMERLAQSIPPGRSMFAGNFRDGEVSCRRGRFDHAET
jgi:hypothetical protein